MAKLDESAMRTTGGRRATHQFQGTTIKVSVRSCGEDTGQRLITQMQQGYEIWITANPATLDRPVHFRDSVTARHPNGFKNRTALI